MNRARPASFPVPQLPTPLPATTGWRWLRLCTVPKFLASPRRPLEDLLMALHAAGRPVALVVAQEAGEVGVYLGTPGEPILLQEALIGHVPGVQLEETSVLDLEGLSWIAALTGFPAADSDLTRLVRGLFHPQGGRRWAYMVWAVPAAEQTVTEGLRALAEDIRRLKNAYLRRGSVEETNNPEVEVHLRRLMQAWKKQQEASLTGGWETTVALAAADTSTRDLGAAFLAAAFAGPSSHPIRIVRSNGHPLGSLPITLLPTPDLAKFLDLPREETPGYRIREVVRGSVAIPKVLQGLRLGSVLDRGRPTAQPFSFPPEDLTKHVFVTGVTGSGKTETCFVLLHQLWQEHHIPFLVIEPAKREYHSLREFPSFRDLTVFRLGTGEEGLRLNPLEVPAGIHVQTHLDLLRTLFHATFAGFYAPMPYLLEEALYRVYMERGWDLVTGKATSPAPACFPTLTDLCRKVDEVVLEAGYDSEVTQNVLTALRVRLNSLRLGAKGRLLDVPLSTPFAEILERPVVLELAALGDPETAAFLMGLLWLRLYEHRMTQGPRPLQHVTLIEEAHRLLAHTIQHAVHPELSNIRAQALETFSHMLAELRAFGEGLIVVDQSPTKLHPDVLKNTNLKVVHRLVAKEDREAIAGCTNMTPAQARALATLSVGEAFAYAEGLDKPVHIRLPLLRGGMGWR